ncbi:MAG: YceI family protein [Acidimicrobiia bacterium]|nr:MAG: YceI family protein [Acidimicrobiia bacterium]
MPAAGTWAIDPGHAQVGFVGRHFGLTKIRGIVGVTSGTVVIAEEVSASTVSVDLDMASVNTGDSTRDDHLRSTELFDVLKYPNATFRSTEISIDGSTGTMIGVLTIKGVGREVSLDIEFLGHATDPWANERAVFSASGKIDREDWGLTWNMILEAGGLLVSKDIRIEIEVELILQST